MRIFLYRIRVFLLILTFFMLLGVSMWYVTMHIISRAPVTRCYHCNVIFISIDTLGAKHTSVYNPVLTTTPFLSQLADSRAIVFNHAYANSSWTLPSHTAMFTGRYPWDVGMMIQLQKLDASIPTIFTAVKAHGYDTVAFSDGTFVNPIWGLTNGIDTFNGAVAPTAWDDSPRLFTEATAWMNDRHSTKPFFLLIHPFEVHDPYGGAYGESGTIAGDTIVASNKVSGGPSKAVSDTFRAKYYEDVQKTDAGLRDFFATLDASPYAQNTIVVITSDHGEEFGEHGTAGVHGISLYNEVLRVPLMIVMPKGAPERLDQTVELRSIPSTLMDMLGYKSDHTFSGDSLLPMVGGTKIPNQQIVSGTEMTRDDFLKLYATVEPKFSEAFYLPLVKEAPVQALLAPRIQSVVKGNLHLIKNEKGTLELYNLATDPDEQKNIYSDRAGLTLEESARLTSMMLAITSRK